MDAEVARIEADEKQFEDRHDCYCALMQFARTLERQRNEARAALAAAAQEVELTRRGISAFEKHINTLRAELEQTRRVRDSLGVGYDEMHDELYSALGMHLTCAAEIDALRQALTAAEQELSECRNRCDEFGDGENISKPVPDCISDGMGKLRSLLNKAEKALTAAEQRADGAEKERDSYASRLATMRTNCENARTDAVTFRQERDTALRERDDARKDTARLDWVQLRKPLLRWDMENGWYVRSGPTPHADSSIRAAIDAALAAKTTEGGERNL